MESKIDRIVEVVTSLENNVASLRTQFNSLDEKIDSLALQQNEDSDEQMVDSVNENDEEVPEGEIDFDFEGHGYSNPRYIAGWGIEVDLDFVLLEKDKGQYYAVRKINLLGDEISHNHVREMYVLFDFDHENILSLEKVLVNGTGRSAYLIMELVDQDLDHYIMKSRETHLKKWMKQLCSALAYLHSRHIIHFNVLPTSIFVTRDGDIKLGGFSKACSLPGDIQDSVQAMCIEYRAPEVCFCFERYTPAIDMWALGCVFWYIAASCTPLFTRGKGTKQHMIDEMCRKLGKPTEEIWPGVTANFPEELATAIYPTPPQALGLIPEMEKKLGAAGLEMLGDDGLDLLRRLLHYNPETRITAQEALEHAYLA